MTKKTVATLHPDMQEALPLYAMPRALMGGTREMRASGETYLPKEPAEVQTAYEIRIKRTVLFEAFSKTVNDMAGRVFAKEIMLGDDVPDQIKTWAENIDLQGTHLNVFSKDVLIDALQVGASYILADTPAGIEGATLANAARPYLIHLKAEDIIGWTTRIDGDSVALEVLRYYETVDIQDGYHVERVRQIKVLLPGAYEVWRQEKDKEWALFDAGTRGIDGIPLSVVYISKRAYMVGKPPLQAIADLNVSHWQSSSDQRNILHVARVPILFGAGWAEDDALIVGAASMARNSDPNATLSYVEHSGYAIESGRNDLKDLEFQMQAMGLQLLMPEPTQSATGEVRDDIKENSRLGAWADALKDAIENCLVWLAELGGLGNDGGSVIINKDFGIAARGIVDIQALIAAHGAGLISAETALKEMIRRGFLSDDMDVETELTLTAEEAVTAMEQMAAMSPSSEPSRTPGNNIAGR